MALGFIVLLSYVAVSAFLALTITRREGLLYFIMNTLAWFLCILVLITLIINYSNNLLSVVNYGLLVIPIAALSILWVWHSKRDNVSALFEKSIIERKKFISILPIALLLFLLFLTLTPTIQYDFIFPWRNNDVVHHFIMAENIYVYERFPSDAWFGGYPNGFASVIAFLSRTTNIPVASVMFPVGIFLHILIIVLIYLLASETLEWSNSSSLFGAVVIASIFCIVGGIRTYTWAMDMSLFLVLFGLYILRKYSFERNKNLLFFILIIQFTAIWTYPFWAPIIPLFLLVERSFAKSPCARADDISFLLIFIVSGLAFGLWVMENLAEYSYFLTEESSGTFIFFRLRFSIRFYPGVLSFFWVAQKKDPKTFFWIKLTLVWCAMAIVTYVGYHMGKTSYYYFIKTFHFLAYTLIIFKIIFALDVLRTIGCYFKKTFIYSLPKKLILLFDGIGKISPFVVIILLLSAAFAGYVIPNTSSGRQAIIFLPVGGIQMTASDNAAISFILQNDYTDPEQVVVLINHSMIETSLSAYYACAMKTDYWGRWEISREWREISLDLNLFNSSNTSIIVTHGHIEYDFDGWNIIFLQDPVVIYTRQ